MRRKNTFFEKALLIVGLVVVFLGFFLINHIYLISGNMLNYEMLTVIFLWIILLFIVVLTATSENQKEEGQIIIKELHEETKLMRQLVKDNLLEIKLLRQDLLEKKKLEK